MRVITSSYEVLGYLNDYESSHTGYSNTHIVWGVPKKVIKKLQKEHPELFIKVEDTKHKIVSIKTRDY